MNRRRVLQGLIAVAAGGGVAVVAARRYAAPDAPPLQTVADSGAALTATHVAAMQQNWRTLLADGVRPPSPADKLNLSDAEWRKRLTAPQYNVLREEGTERAGTSPLNAEKRAGVYACTGCALPLFTSEMKYESGTGWPSFFTLIPGVFGTKKDFHLIYARTEYHCLRCGGHHGHLFEDGPKPTGLRYCNNGVALTFIPKSAKA